MDVYGAIFSQSVQSRTKNRLFFVKRVDTRKPILFHENAIVYSKTLGAFREPISTPALIRRQIVRQCRNTCTMAFTMIGCVWFTSKSELAIRVTVCVAGGVARGIVDLSRVLSRGSRSPRLAVQPRHDPLRRLGFRPGSAACAILKAALKTTTLHAGRELPTLDTGVAIFSPWLTKIKMIQFHYPRWKLSDWKEKQRKGSRHVNFDKL